jgi:hypothetical protein
LKAACGIILVSITYSWRAARVWLRINPMEDEVWTPLPRLPRLAQAAAAGIGILCLVGQGTASASMPYRASSLPIASYEGSSQLGTPGFTDSFGTAVDNDPSYGLNDSLDARQTGTQGITYTRASGLWYPAPAPRPWYSQVNHVNHPGVLSFWLGSSAIRMDDAVVAGTGGTVGVQAVVDPVAGDTSSADWSSLVLDTSSSDSGWVANPDVAVGVLVRSNGGIQVYQGSTLLASKDGFAQPASGGQFLVSFAYTPGQKVIHLTVNNASIDVTAPAALPVSATLFSGAYLNNSSEVSTLSDLEVSAVSMDSGCPRWLSCTSPLHYYGYYAARLAGGPSHLAEVAGRSNLNWVNISDASGYRADILSGCAPASCVVNTGFEFFSCTAQASSPSGQSCSLYPNYAARWAAEANAVRPYLDKIAAFYILDEPQWNGATPAEINTSAQLIKQTFPGAKVMMIEAGPKITPSLTIPSSVNWIGFDWYCQPFSTIQARLATLQSLVPASSPQRFFLVPEDAPLSQCAGVAGHTTDADIAALQWDYFRLAEQNPRVIGLMNFGFWTSPPWTTSGGTGASELPLTVDANERVAAQILASGH